MLFVYATVTDSAGNVVTDYDKPVQFTVSEVQNTFIPQRRKPRPASLQLYCGSDSKAARSILRPQLMGLFPNP